MSNANVCNLTHPDYQQQLQEWIKWRYTYESGTAFIRKYLRQFTNREDPDDFTMRRDISYCPAFAKAALDEVKNSIYQRMADVSRQGGSKKYQAACEGGNGGVDLCGSSMNYYIGCNVLEEMLKMRKVGVYVDMPSDVGQSQADSAHKHPYLYTYITEDIRAWKLDETGDPFFNGGDGKVNTTTGLYTSSSQYIGIYRLRFEGLFAGGADPTTFIISAKDNAGNVLKDQNGNNIQITFDRSIKIKLHVKAKESFTKRSQQVIIHILDDGFNTA